MTDSYGREPLTEVFGKRYGEVLLVHIGESGPEATVYCSFPLNDCPHELWSKLDPQAIASENDAELALLNGPRHWPMSSIEKAAQGAQVKNVFGRKTIDNALSLADLPGLANHLDLPAGWTYKPRTLASPLRVDTTSRKAHVIQDDLAKSYSSQTG